MMEKALADYLLAQASITSLIGNRIYWVELPQGAARPYLLLSVVSSQPGVAYQGATGLIMSRVQFDCWGLTFYSAKDVARALEELLNGKRLVTVTRVFEGFLLDTERDGHEDVETPDKLFRTSLDFIIWHKGV